MSCPFCFPDAAHIFHRGPLALGLWDAYPVSPGHALLVPLRHVASWFDASPEEQRELLAGVDVARDRIEELYEPNGFNIGINVGDAAGQTVSHLHVHVIPRYDGDVESPRGGVRNVIPALADYTDQVRDRGVIAPYRYVSSDRGVTRPTPSSLERDAPHRRALITGEDDPLLRHVAAHLGRATAADFAVAFVLGRGMGLIEPHLVGLLERNGHLRFLTGDYLGVTDPAALRRLMDLREKYPARVELRVFESGAGSFHPKSYLVYDSRGADVPKTGLALVGSSNLSQVALQHGVEWNYRTVGSRDVAGFAEVVAGFEALFRHPRTRPLDSAWIEAYRARRPALRSVPLPPLVVPEEKPEPPPVPHEIQARALEALAATRTAGNSAGLVVLATGLGKTWLSAFDSDQGGFKRVLFIAHREEILNQAMATFRRIRPDADLGRYTGIEKSPDADVVFASVQTLGRRTHLDRFAPSEFDYVIVDEFHHAAAKTYRRVIDHFDPQFLLGLTATPERTDGGDLLGLCQENLVYRCDLPEGIRRGLLSRFHYFGVPDDVDYANIPWRSNRFDEKALTTALATQARAANAFGQYQDRGGERTLAFCCSQRHANFMRQFFRQKGARCAAVHSGDESDPRVTSLEDLDAGKLDVVFAVDMFNEGVDLPRVDTVMMLRPTESRILWLQQFGRGLRTADGKDHLRVIDYIGNHRTFLLKTQVLFNLQPGDAHVGRALDLLQAGEVEMPDGCEVTYDLEAIEILRGLLRPVRGDDALRFAYQDFRERNGQRPTASELHHEGYGPRSARRSYGSWLGFVDHMGDLSAAEQKLMNAGRGAELLRALETTPMTRSYKMLVLLAMLAREEFPGATSIDGLREGVRRLARRSAMLQEDLGPGAQTDEGLVRLLEKNPIDAWTGGKGTSGTPYFEYVDGTFRTTFDLAPERREAYRELAREIVDWRLAEYLGRRRPSESGFACRVSHADGRPILFLPPRDSTPGIPEGWTTIRANDEEFEANFVKVAVNVVRKPGDTANRLPELLRSWFGESAGLPGTRCEVTFEVSDVGLVMSPANGPSREVTIGSSHARKDIPPLFGLEFAPRAWEQGYVSRGGQIFLFVTLDKSGMPEDHQYGDRFLSPSLFEWKSQNRHTQKGKPGQLMKRHREENTPVHLFVRKTRMLNKKAAPFIYCGELEFVSWEGDKPITIRWRLAQPLSAATREFFGV